MLPGQRGTVRVANDSGTLVRLKLLLVTGKKYPQQDLHLHWTVFETAASAVGLCGLVDCSKLLTGGFAPPTPRV